MRRHVSDENGGGGMDMRDKKLCSLLLLGVKEIEGSENGGLYHWREMKGKLSEKNTCCEVLFCGHCSLHF